jgi:hypothetical protein
MYIRLTCISIHFSIGIFPTSCLITNEFIPKKKLAYKKNC